jgi:hypothetical protein
MKIMALFAVLVLVYLFYPTYDLHLKADAFSDQYELHEADFLSLDKCKAAATAAAKNKPYHCYKTSMWKNMFGGYTQYNPQIRDSQKELSEE